MNNCIDYRHLIEDALGIELDRTVDAALGAIAWWREAAQVDALVLIESDGRTHSANIVVGSRTYAARTTSLAHSLRVSLCAALYDHPVVARGAA